MGFCRGDALGYRVEKALADAVTASAGEPFERQMETFLIAAGGELSRIGAPQLLWGRGDPMLRPFVEQRLEAVVYRRIDDLFQAGYRVGALNTAPELLSCITRGAVERLLTSQLPLALNRTAADLLRETVHVVLRGALVHADTDTDTSANTDSNPSQSPTTTRTAPRSAS